jgi:hypothetical protein
MNVHQVKQKVGGRRKEEGGFYFYTFPIPFSSFPFYAVVYSAHSAVYSS